MRTILLGALTFAPIAGANQLPTKAAASQSKGT